MKLVRLAVCAAALAATLAPAAAQADPICVIYPDPTQWIHVCSDPSNPRECLVYGALGLEGAFGGRCDRPPDAELRGTPTMSIARAVTVLAVAAGALAPATAHAAQTCAPAEYQYPYVCHDPDYPTCLAYGSLGEEAMYGIGKGCPWPYGPG